MFKKMRAEERYAASGKYIVISNQWEEDDLHQRSLATFAAITGSSSLNSNRKEIRIKLNKNELPKILSWRHRTRNHYSSFKGLALICSCPGVTKLLLHQYLSLSCLSVYYFWCSITDGYMKNTYMYVNIDWGNYFPFIL